MALTLVKETGEVVSGANSYATAADGDSYHEGHLYATAWTAALSTKKEAALVMASRLIDACYQFGGFKTSSAQSMQWPRQRCPDPDAYSAVDSALGGYRMPEFADNEIPTALVNATCELARELIKSDTTDAPEGQGVSQITVTGVTHIQFDKKDRQQQIPRTVQLMLMKLGTYLNSPNGAVRLTRV